MRRPTQHPPQRLACPICGDDRYIVADYLLCWQMHGAREAVSADRDYAIDGREIVPNKAGKMLAGVKEGVRLMELEAKAKEANE